MNRLLLALALVVQGGLPLAGSAAPPTARYQIVKDEGGVWWFQARDGTRFYSLGIDNVSPEPYQPRVGTTFYNPVPTEFHGQTGAWADSVSKLLIDHGFNTLGAWSSTAIPTGHPLLTTPVLYVVENEPTRCLAPLRPDFEDYVRRNVATALRKLPDHDGLLGVFLDNEMPWYGKSGWDDIPTYTLLEQAFELPQTDVRRIAALDFLKSRHASPAQLSESYHRTIAAWNDLDSAFLKSCSSPDAAADRLAFTAQLASRFFEVTTRIVRHELPDTLILGTRIPGNAPDAVIRSCAQFCDVISLNDYRAEPTADVQKLTRFWVLGGGKPIMHTEFSWRARQNSSGDPNTRGAGAVLETQAERAAAYSSLVADMASVPYVIASHWFEFADQAPQGRFDGEDSNYGVVDVHNKPYTELLAAMGQTNARVHDIHAKTTRKMPTELPKARQVVYSPGQHPERPAKLDLLQEWIHDPEIWGAPDAHMSWKRRGADLVLTYDAGSQYGAGINIFGPRSAALPQSAPSASDLDGYTKFVIKGDIPKGLQVNIVLAEAGAAAPSTPKFDTSAGDDGEAYVSAPLFGEGPNTTLTLPISLLLKQPYFGNQNGAMRIDMQAVRNFGLQLSGEPRRGEVVIRELTLQK